MAHDAVSGNGSGDRGGPSSESVASPPVFHRLHGKRAARPRLRSAPPPSATVDEPAACAQCCAQSALVASIARPLFFDAPPGGAYIHRVPVGHGPAIRRPVPRNGRATCGTAHAVGARLPSLWRDVAVRPSRVWSRDSRPGQNGGPRRSACHHPPQFIADLLSCHVTYNAQGPWLDDLVLLAALSSRWFIIRWPGRYVGASDAALLFVLDSSCACACFVARRRTGNMGSWRDC